MSTLKLPSWDISPVDYTPSLPSWHASNRPANGGTQPECAIDYSSRISFSPNSGDGDNDAARERLAIVHGIDVLQTTDAANELAAKLIAAHAVPETEPRDALHIALAAIHGIDCLATWNFKHIMNPSTQHLIDAVCRDAGIESAVICTPEQLWVTYDDS